MANTGQPFLDTLGDDDAEVQKQQAEALPAFHISKKLFSDRLPAQERTPLSFLPRLKRVGFPAQLP
jgi:hypothetical protein